MDTVELKLEKIELLLKLRKEGLSAFSKSIHFVDGYVSTPLYSHIEYLNQSTIEKIDKVIHDNLITEVKLKS